MITILFISWIAALLIVTLATRGKKDTYRRKSRNVECFHVKDENGSARLIWVTRDMLTKEYTACIHIYASERNVYLYATSKEEIEAKILDFLQLTGKHVHVF